MASLVARVVQRYRVARRYLTAGSLPLGKTFQNDQVRVHRYSDSLRVTDLTDAGKRGKKCREMTVMLTYSYQGKHDEWFARMGGFFVDEGSRGGFDAICRFITDVQVDFPTEISIEMTDLRAIDVEPNGESFEFRIPQRDKGYIEVVSSPLDFRITDHHAMEGPPGKPGFFQDTSYHPQKKRDAQTFYAWMRDNHERARRFISLDMFRKTWATLGVKVDYH